MFDYFFVKFDISNLVKSLIFALRMYTLLTPQTRGAPYCSLIATSDLGQREIADVLVIHGSFYPRKPA